MDALAELAATLARDPAEAARSAREIADHARSCGDLPTVGRAGVIRGRAMLLLGEIALAEQALAESVDSARTSGDPSLEAEAQLAIAAVHSSAGRHHDAFAALDVVDRLGTAMLVQRATLQRAAVCRDARRYDEALRLFRSATERLRSDGNDLDLARVLANCGGILTLQGRIDEAVVELGEAVALLRRGGHEFVALQVVHDLACAESFRGDLATALRLLDQAEQGMAAMGHDASFPLLSRAEALLRAGLTADAAAAANDAARRLANEGHTMAALALVVAAEAARLDGDAATARRLAEQAIDQFGADGTSGWERTARLEAIRARDALGDLDVGVIHELDTVATAAAAADDHRTQVEAGALLASVATRLGAPRTGAAHLVEADRLARRSGLAQLTAAVAVAHADVALASGDLRGARRAANRALRAVTAAKQMYGAGESNPALGTEGRAAVDVTLRIAAREQAATRRLAWTERARTLAGASSPVTDRPPQFAALRAVASELRHAERTAQPTDELRRQQARIESEIRTHMLREQTARCGGEAGPVPLGLHRLLGERTLVSIAFAPGHTVAVVVDRRGARTVDLASPAALREAAVRAAASLRGLSAISAPSVADARRRAFTAAVDRLDELVLRPLRVRSDDVVLVVPPELVAVPWAATATLRARRFALAPSVAWWRNASDSPLRRTGATLVVAGPRLDHADVEADRVAACHPGATVLRGEGATVAATAASFGCHDLAHVVAHGRFRHDNPLWSTIELADGPMTVYELQQLASVPHTIVIATCESAITAGRGGIELQGLAASLLALGTRTVVASVGPLPDDAATVSTMVALHRDLGTGIGASESLRSSRLDIDEDDPTAGALITIGLGT